MEEDNLLPPIKERFEDDSDSVEIYHAEDYKTHVFPLIISFNLLSTLMLTIMLLFYVTFYNHLLIPLYNIVSDFETSNMILAGMTDIVQTWITNTQILPAILDYIWLISFIILIAEVLYVSYSAKRDGHFTYLALMSYGVIFILFIMSIISLVSSWFYDIIINRVLMGFVFNTPFFTWYITNCGWVNLLIIFLCIFANFIDLDFKRWETGKQGGIDEV